MENTVAGDFTFQQDNAPAHRAGETGVFVSQYTRFHLTVAVATQ